VIVVATHIKLDNLIATNELVHRQATFLPSLQSVKLVSGGFNKLAADLYWLALIQYCGAGIEQRGKPYERCYDYVNLITGLDPKFTKPYWFGCWSIGYWQKRPDLADRILQRGMVENPDAWDLAYLAGINEYLFASDYKRAAHYYRIAAQKPGAPDWLSRQATILESNIPEMVKKAKVLEDMYFHASDVHLKIDLYGQLMPLLEELERASITDMSRQATQARIEQLKADFERNVE
jgi:hypothetical protein